MAKKIQWAGYQWSLRDDENSGPGPNQWSSNNVWLGDDDKLHLKLRRSTRTGQWTCAELYTDEKFGYGTFRWFIEGPLDKLDPNVVLGLFTYGNTDGANEIDIEVAKWGQTDLDAQNLSYTVYPHTVGAAKQVTAGTCLSLQGTYTTHQFTWSPTYVYFQSQHGFQQTPDKNKFFSYQTPEDFSAAIPRESVPLHMNLWCYDGRTPSNYEEVEILIHDFKYTKA